MILLVQNNQHFTLDLKQPTQLIINVPYINFPKSRLHYLNISRTLYAPLHDQTSADLGTVSQKSRELFGPEELVVKLQSVCLKKLTF